MQEGLLKASGEGADEYDSDGPTAIRVDFHELIDESHALKDRLLPMQRILGSVTVLRQNGKIHEAYANSVDRIHKETRYFEEWEKLGINADIILHYLDFRLAGADVPVSFVMEGGILGENVQGGFSPSRRKIFIKVNPDVESETLQCLATEGYIPDAGRLIHEAAHAFQFSKSKFLNWLEMLYGDIVNKGNYRTELREAHAYRAGGAMPYDRENPDGSVSHGEHLPTPEAGIAALIRRFKSFDFREHYPNVDVDKLIYAFEAVDRMKVLGFTTAQIGEVIQESGSWDKEKAQYPAIESKIADRTQERGFDEYDIANMVQAEKLKKEIERLKAMEIAQEEIEKLSRS